MSTTPFLQFSFHISESAYLHDYQAFKVWSYIDHGFKPACVFRLHGMAH